MPISNGSSLKQATLQLHYNKLERRPGKGVRMSIAAAAIREIMAQELKTNALRIAGNETFEACKIKALGSNPREKGVLFVAAYNNPRLQRNEQQLLRTSQHQANSTSADGGNTSITSGSDRNTRSNNADGGLHNRSTEANNAGDEPCNKNAHDISRPFPSNPRRKTCILVCDDPNISAQELLETANSVLISLYAWDAALSACVMDEQPLTELFRIASQLIPYPFVLFGANLSVIAASPHQRKDDFNLAESKRIADDSAEELIMDSEYQDAAKYVEPFYFTDTRQINFYGMNFFKNDEYTARIIFNLGDKAQLNTGQEFIIGRFLHACVRALDRLKFAPNASKNRDLMTHLIKNVIEDSSLSNRETTDALFYYGWRETDTFQVVRIAFHQGTYWQNDADHLCQTLEHNPLACLAASINGEVLWLVNLSASLAGSTHSAAALKAMENAAIAGFCAKYAGRAGESLPFCGFEQLKEGYREAGAALSVGYRENPELWHYRFKDYILPYILGKITDEISTESLCHPALACLRAHDTAHGTHLATTLVEYVRCGQSVSKTADELDVHRTSLQRRLERIKEIAGLDFDNHKDITHILISALLLGM